MAIEVIKNQEQPSLPRTFRLPFKGSKANENEPNIHENGIRTLTKAVFEHQETSNSVFLDYFNEKEGIVFLKSERTWLTLMFDGGIQHKKKVFAML